MSAYHLDVEQCKLCDPNEMSSINHSNDSYGDDSKRQRSQLVQSNIFDYFWASKTHRRPALTWFYFQDSSIDHRAYSDSGPPGGRSDGGLTCGKWLSFSFSQIVHFLNPWTRSSLTLPAGAFTSTYGEDRLWWRSRRLNLLKYLYGIFQRSFPPLSFRRRRVNTAERRFTENVMG